MGIVRPPTEMVSTISLGISRRILPVLKHSGLPPKLDETAVNASSKKIVHFDCAIRGDTKQANIAMHTAGKAQTVLAALTSFFAAEILS